jgi:DNA-binding transcriptional regulator YdaS (Cro superfamily)
MTDHVPPELLRKSMDVLGSSKGDLCDILGVHPKTVEAWLSGRRPIPVYVGTCMWLLEKLALIMATSGDVRMTKH